MNFQSLFSFLGICLLSACVSKNTPNQLSEGELKKKVEQLSLDLVNCILKQKILPNADDKAKKVLTQFHKQFEQEPCTGCHTGRRSLSETGRIAFIGSEIEFAKGLAIRHHQTMGIVDICLKENSAREDFKIRIIENTRINSSSGDRFFISTGDLKKDEDIAASFLQGAFESRMSKGDPLFDLAYSWIEAGSYLPPEAYGEVLAELIGLFGYMETVSVVD